MDSFKKLKLFPDKWYKVYDEDEIRRARGQLTAYTVAKDLDVGISEVGNFQILPWMWGETFVKDFSPKKSHDVTNKAVRQVL